MAAKTNKLFISFALRDRKAHDDLLEQLKKEQTQYSFEEMPIKQSWEPAWKDECREKVTGCDAVIALVTKNIIRADGQQWELRCAYDAKMPVTISCPPSYPSPWVSATSMNGLLPPFQRSSTGCRAFRIILRTRYLGRHRAGPGYAVHFLGYASFL